MNPMHRYSHTLIHMNRAYGSDDKNLPGAQRKFTYAWRIKIVTVFIFFQVMEIVIVIQRVRIFKCYFKMKHKEFTPKYIANKGLAAADVMDQSGMEGQTIKEVEEERGKMDGRVIRYIIKQ